MAPADGEADARNAPAEHEKAEEGAHAAAVDRAQEPC